MDKRFLFPNLNSDFKLTRAASFSELSATKKITIEEQFHSKTGGNLIKQYSCEQIFDQKTNTSKLKVSQTYKSGDEEHTSTWNTISSAHDFLNNSGSLRPNNSLSNLKQMSISNQQLAITGSDSNLSKSIIAPAKLFIKDSASKKNQSKEDNPINHFVNNQQVDKKISESTTEFKVPLPPKIISEKSHLIRDRKTSDDCIEDIKDFQDLVDKNTSDENLKTKDISELKKKLRSLVPIKSENTKRIYLCWSFMFIILLLITILFLVVFLNNEGVANGLCDPHFTSNEIPQYLKKSLYGQDSAVNDLSRYFIDRNDQTGFDILVLVGGIGVGKSYTAEIIKNSLQDTYNILEYYPPLFKKEDQAYRSISVCKCNLVRLENLKTDDILDAVMFLKKLQKTLGNYCILTLALFNTQETDLDLKRTLDLNRSVSIIDDKFKEEGLQPILVSFISLSDEALTKCIKDAADYAGVKLSNNDIEYVRRDLLLSDSGCKGAYAKVQLVGKAVKSDL